MRDPILAECRSKDDRLGYSSCCLDEFEHLAFEFAQESFVGIARAVKSM
jgi:hypothetical protein